ncbi:hypothetical protein [Megamonas funiformis]|uniref:hypothetical protein n=1 Tax=Megamonas funiformis TaxID=437897 RepID=UPI00388F3CE4
MRKILGLFIFICLIFSGICFAMQFSQPVKIGGISTPKGGVSIVNASYNDGNYWRKYDKNNTKSYEKGIAGFGNGKDIIYVHYNYNVYEGFYFGGKDKNNTIKDDFPCYDIYKMNTNENITIYILSKIYGPEFDYLIIGKRADGKFVKYIDTREITKRYFGWNMQGASTAMYKDLNVQGDTLVMKYHDWKTATEGKFIFKWDDNAQWFSVDRTVDKVRSGY